MKLLKKKLPTCPLLLSIIAAMAPMISKANETISNVSDTDAASIFLEMTTEREYANGKFPILKWDTTTARVAVIFEPHHHNQVTRELLPLLEDVRDVIFQETGFTYQFPRTPDPEDPMNVFMTFGTPEELINLSGDLEARVNFNGYQQLLIDQNEVGLPVCGVAAIWSEDHALKAIAIAVDATNSTKKCVNKMFFQSLGLVTDPEMDFGSITDDDLQVDDISDDDKLLMRVLYSDGIEPGSIPSQQQILDLISQNRKQ